MAWDSTLPTGANTGAQLPAILQNNWNAIAAELGIPGSDLDGFLRQHFASGKHKPNDVTFGAGGSTLTFNEITASPRSNSIGVNCQWSISLLRWEAFSTTGFRSIALSMNYFGKAVMKIKDTAMTTPWLDTEWDKEIVLADVNGLVDTERMMFNVYNTANQSFSAGVEAVVLTDTDTISSNYDLVNDKFEPGISGMYQIGGYFNALIYSGTEQNFFTTIKIYKNTTAIRQYGSYFSRPPMSAWNKTLSFVSEPISMNGSSDYIQVKFEHFNSGELTVLVGGSISSHIWGNRISGLR